MIGRKPPAPFRFTPPDRSEYEYTVRKERVRVLGDHDAAHIWVRYYRNCGVHLVERRHLRHLNGRKVRKGKAA